MLGQLPDGGTLVRGAGGRGGTGEPRRERAEQDRELAPRQRGHGRASTCGGKRYAMLMRFRR